jgi:hypothetical protein
LDVQRSALLATEHFPPRRQTTAPGRPHTDRAAQAVSAERQLTSEPPLRAMLAAFDWTQDT